MTKNEINELITFIKNNATLSSIFGQRVQYFSFLNIPVGTSLVVFDHSDNEKLVVNESFLDFRVIVGDEITPIVLRGYLEKIKQVFFKNDMIIGNTKYFQIDYLNDIFIAKNAKGHEGVVSFIFKK